MYGNPSGHGGARPLARSAGAKNERARRPREKNHQTDTPFRDGWYRRSEYLEFVCAQLTIVPLYDQVACMLADKNIAVLVIQVVPIDQYSLPAAERRHAGNRLIVRCQNRGFGMGNRRPLLTAPIRLAFRLPRRLSTSSVLEPSFEPRDDSKSPAQETADQHSGRCQPARPPPLGS